jgi:alpha 1,3-mannosyltransferase
MTAGIWQVSFLAPTCTKTSRLILPLGWAAKAFAILMSSFHEAIFIDADSFFLVDPTTLFEDEGYRKTGALFFKDRNVSPESKRAWIKSILPAPISTNVKHNRMWTGESGHMQESGVIVVDKWRHFIPMLLATRLNGPDRDGDEAKGKRGVYDMFYGDKETFWLSWEMAGSSDYTFHGGVAGTMGKLTHVQPSDPEKPDEEPVTVDGPMICSPQLIHFDHDGKPIWFNGWLAANKDDLQEWQEFDAYLEEEPEQGRKPKKDAWSIHPANVVCLEAAEAKTFSARDQTTLDGILKLAKKNSAMLDSS